MPLVQARPSISKVDVKQPKKKRQKVAAPLETKSDQLKLEPSG
jgi:hypothetical protein